MARQGQVISLGCAEIPEPRLLCRWRAAAHCAVVVEAIQHAGQPAEGSACLPCLFGWLDPEPACMGILAEHKEAGDMVLVIFEGGVNTFCYCFTIA